MPRVIAIGECMIELSQDDAGGFRPSYAEDTFDSAIYMSRLGLAVEDATAFGEDRYSDAAVAMMRAESVGTIVAGARVRAVDATGAGDGLNAACLAARVFGATADEAAKAGHRLAAAVQQARAAILPSALLPIIGIETGAA